MTRLLIPAITEEGLLYRRIPATQLLWWLLTIHPARPMLAEVPQANPSFVVRSA